MDPSQEPPPRPQPPRVESPPPEHELSDKPPLQQTPESSICVDLRLHLPQQHSTPLSSPTRSSPQQEEPPQEPSPSSPQQQPIEAPMQWETSGSPPCSAQQQPINISPSSPQRQPIEASMQWETSGSPPCSPQQQPISSPGQQLSPHSLLRQRRIRRMSDVQTLEANITRGKDTLLKRKKA